MANALRFFLAEQAAYIAHRIGGNRGLPFAGARHQSADTAELRFNHSGREAANVRNKFGIRCSALNHERHRGAAFTAASATTTAGFTQQPADAVGGARDRASYLAKRVRKRGSHFEIEIIF